MGGQAKLSYEGLIGFETVFVYDRNMQAGFNQITTDKALSPRIDFCTAGVASTNGTHEMQTVGFGPSGSWQGGQIVSTP